MSAKFNATKEEFALIAKIAGRAKFLSRGTGSEYQMADCVMDIEAAHCSGNPLMLAELLGANDGDFCHDVFGIRRHINRETGALDGGFSPRYSVPEGSKQINGASAAEATARSEGGGGGAAPVSPVQAGGFFVKKPIPVKAERLSGTGVVTTDRGESLGFIDGDWLITSQDGQSWPVSAEYFARNYEPFREAVDSDVAHEVVALLPNEQVGALAEIAALSGSSFDEVLSQAVGFAVGQAGHVFGVTLGGCHGA